MLFARRRRSFLRAVTYGVLLAFTGGPWTVYAQTVLPATVQRGDTEQLVSLNFRDAPLDQVLEFYSQLTGRTMIRAPGISATITLRGQTRLSETEALQAIDSVLAMHNVALVPMGEKFLKVVQPGTVRQEGLGIGFDLPDDSFPEADKLISQVINLTFMEIAEIQPIIQSLIHGYGKIQPLERTNSLLITDTAANIRRILEVIEFVDRPVEIQEDMFVRELMYAEASQVAGRLNELIADAEDRDVRARPAARAAPRPDDEAPRGPPGVIRPRREQPEAPAATADVAELVERGIIHGRVKIVADDRINTLFIISRPVNFAFFDRIIDVLDRPVDPEIIVRVISLEYAQAEDLAGILNEFIGAVAADRPTRAVERGVGAEDTPAARAEALRDFVAARAERLQEVVSEDATRFGRLSPLTQILSDKRTNSLLLMGRRSDIAALEEIIDQLDVMLGQVLIEAVILEVNLSDTLDYGISWLQRSLEVVSEERVGPGRGVTIAEPVAAFGGGFMGRETSFIDAGEVGRATTLSPGALTYYATLHGLNVDAVIRLAATTGDARVLSTPVIMTTDNTEARIIVGEQRPVVTSTAVSGVGDRTVSSYQYKDIGINLTVTPRINPQRIVVMEISQSADDVVGTVTIDDNEVPIITKREFEASVSVASRSTIALGGLVRTDDRLTRTKVPVLGDIPLLGLLFRTQSLQERRTELIVLLTPYVVMTPEEAREETYRLHHAGQSSQTQWHRGWSDSEFAYPPNTERVYYPFTSPEDIQQLPHEERDYRAKEKLPPDAVFQVIPEERPVVRPAEPAPVPEPAEPVPPPVEEEPTTPRVPHVPVDGDIFAPVPVW